MGPEALALQEAYKVGGITLAVIVGLLLVSGALARLLWGTKRENDQLRAAESLGVKADLQVAQQRLDSVQTERLKEHAAAAEHRLAAQQAMSKVLLDEMHAQRDALESSAKAARDQADALDAVTKSIGELREETRALSREIAALRAGKKGPV